MRIIKKGTFKALIVLLLVLSVSLTAVNIYNNSYVSTFSEENKGEMETKLNEIVKDHVKKNNFSGSVLAYEQMHLPILPVLRQEDTKIHRIFPDDYLGTLLLLVCSS